MKIDPDLISAALRHIRDARALLDTSPDQAWHLGGFGPECARKACLPEAFHKVLGHELDGKLLDYVLSLEPGLNRYSLTIEGDRLQAWRPDARYKKTGTYKKPEAQALVDEASAWMLRLLAELWADGKLKEIPNDAL